MFFFYFCRFLLKIFDIATVDFSAPVPDFETAMSRSAPEPIDPSNELQR